MNRSVQTSAIVISLRPSGENNTSVTLLTPDKGIIYGTLYGGPKSKMRSLVTMFNSGKVWLYENPEKNQIKLTDFEVTNYHPSFNQSLLKVYAASLAVELAVKTRCAGSYSQCFNLIEGFFEGMELCDEDQSRVGLLRFLWRYLELLGVQPPATNCSGCGKSFLSAKFAPNSVSYYNGMENNFICPDCAPSDSESGTVMKMQTSAVQYLAAISALTPAEVRKIQISKETYDQIKQLVFFLIENTVDQPLYTIESGTGIL